MTGWRLGWMVAPEAYVPAIDKLSQNIYLAASTPSQYAALAAFEPQTLALLDARRDEFRARRDYLVPALRALGFDIPCMPQGAFYIYAGCAAMTPDSFAFANDLLEQAGVAITPGIDFGHHAPERHVRFAYTRPVEVLAEGVKRRIRGVSRPLKFTKSINTKDTGGGGGGPRAKVRKGNNLSINIKMDQQDYQGGGGNGWLTRVR